MSWQNYNQSILRNPQLGFSLDLSLMEIGPDFVANMMPKVQKAFDDIKALEAGAIANPDENRLVGHYWLRNPELAPTPELREAGRRSVWLADPPRSVASLGARRQ